MLLGRVQPADHQAQHGRGDQHRVGGDRHPALLRLPRRALGLLRAGLVRRPGGPRPLRAALAFNPDTNGDGKIEATEAFGYANTVRNPLDLPNFDESSPAGGQIRLGRTYIVWWWWCWILREVLSRPYRELPQAEYYARLHNIRPELSKLAASLDDQSAVLREEMTATVSDLVARAFNGGE